MYFQKIFNIILKEDTIKQENIVTETVKAKEIKKTVENKQTSKDQRAYCLFANTGQSFLAMYNNNKINIILSGIEHPDKYDSKSKEANQYINDKIKKKNVFLNVLETLDNGDIIAEVFLDSTKQESLNSMLKDLGLDKKTDVKDEKILKETGVKKTEVLPNNKNNDKQKSDSIIGYLKEYGAAPYLNKNGNKQSYYIMIETDDGTITKWGLDFERAIQQANVNKGDYIKINKSGTNNINDKKLNLWEVIKLEDAHTLASKQDGPPINYEDQPDYLLTEDGYQAPMDWPDESEYFNIDDENYHKITKKETEQSEEPPYRSCPEPEWFPDWDTSSNIDNNMPPEPPPEEGYTSTKKMRM